MRTVKSLIEELKKFPDDASCYGYEGKWDGLLVWKDHKEGFISTGSDEEYTEEFFITGRDDD